MAPHITDLPIEVLERILVLGSDPPSIGRISQTNHFFYGLVYLTRESPLWREVWMGQGLDDLRHCGGGVLGDENGTKGKSDRKGKGKVEEGPDEDEGGRKPRTTADDTRKRVDWREHVQRYSWIRNFVHNKRTPADMLGSVAQLEKALATIIWLVTACVRPYDPMAVEAAEAREKALCAVEEETLLNAAVGMMNALKSKTLETVFDEEKFGLGRFIDMLEDHVAATDADTTTSTSTSNNKDDSDSPTDANEADCGTSTTKPLRPLTFAERQLLSKIHTLYGLTPGDSAAARRVRSRSSVYNLRKYKPENDYGPYLSNGCVDWESLQALQHVIGLHIMELGETDDKVRPMTLLDTQPLVVPSSLEDEVDEDAAEDGDEEDEDEEEEGGEEEEDEEDERAGKGMTQEEKLKVLERMKDPKYDWAGVGGRWTVSFAFCDHGDLLSFNTSNGIDTAWFEDESFSEAVQHMLAATLVVTGTEEDPQHPDHPIIHFAGEMETTSTSTMIGQVKMSPDNQILWHFVSGEEGNAMWSSEAVQIGGVRSNYGVLGVWTTIFHDWDDPVGPLWLRRRI